MHVFLFSDHVSVEDEIALKRRGAERGRLVMGPECGTAMLGGVGLGFANVVRRGPVGIVAAAGTGAQEASVLLDARRLRRVGDHRRRRPRPVGAGRRDHVPGRDGAAGRRRRDRDAAAGLEAAGRRCGAGARRRRRARQARGRGVRRLGRRRGAVRRLPHARGRRMRRGATARRRRGTTSPSAREGGELLGLFSGGSLAHEAQTILGPGHRILDLGEEEYTQGRPHPMVDLELRRRMLREDGAERGLHPARRRARPRRAPRSRRRAGGDARASSRASGR